MNRAGMYVSNLSGDLEYNSFKPSPLPPNPEVEVDGEMLGLVIKANKSLAVLESVSSRIPNVKQFVSMYVRKEALLSSQIEGTQCTLEDVLNPLNIENANRDVSDVVNYIKAVEYGVNRLKELPLCGRLIREIHAVLMENVRGEEKNPGEFRHSQNWIGGAGGSLKNARYIPPNVEDMETAFSDLEIFMNEEEGLDPLIKAALIHYQFETIHPFLDGNGRVGRLLIVLYLMESKIITTPSLYISYFLKNNRIEYYDRMTEVRRSGNYEQWIKFFLSVLYDAAEDAVVTIDKLNALFEKDSELIKVKGKGFKNNLKMFDFIASNPITETGKTAEALGISYNTAARIIDFFVGKGILVLSDKVGKKKIYSYENYLSILKEGT